MKPETDQGKNGRSIAKQDPVVSGFFRQIVVNVRARPRTEVVLGALTNPQTGFV